MPNGNKFYSVDGLNVERLHYDGEDVLLKCSDGNYYSVNDSETIDLIRNNPKERQRFLKTILDARAFVRNYKMINELDIDSEDSAIRHNLNKIKTAINKLQNEGFVIKEKSSKDNRKYVLKLTKKGEEIIEKLTVNGRGKTSRKFERGYYTVTLVKTGAVLEFCVTEPIITHTVKDGVITVTANPSDANSVISHFEFRERTRTKQGTDYQQQTVEFYNPCCASLSKLCELTDMEKKTGVFSRPIPEDAENFKVNFQNKYGMWTHTMVKI